MRLEPPFWWYQSDDTLIATSLRPVSALYGLAAKLRFRSATCYRSNLPVICVGNFTAGGAGKTPLAIHLASEVAKSGLRPVFLTRGYGGKLAGPHLVDQAIDTAHDVGDEALLLAFHAPVIVARDRVAGAKVIETLACDVIVMDDGLQNPSLCKSFAMAVIDGQIGLGNERVIPSGPLRAPLNFQLKLVDAIIVTNVQTVTDIPSNLGNCHCPIYEAQIYAKRSVCRNLSGKTVVAFAGIGRPQKFYHTLTSCGANIVGKHGFPDHHMFTDEDAKMLIAIADAHNAQLVTTEKDWMRFNDRSGPCGELRARAVPLPISLRFPGADRPIFLHQVLTAIESHSADR